MSATEPAAPPTAPRLAPVPPPGEESAALVSAPEPLGTLLAVCRGSALVELSQHGSELEALARLRARARERGGAIPLAPEAPTLARLAEELRSYFAGSPAPFTVPLAPEGTEFRRRVWETLLAIPRGATWSYGELAAEVGRPGGARAVGQANGANPIGIVIPCHRVVAADGGLGGYATGLERKRWLLRLEGALGDELPFEG